MSISSSNILVFSPHPDDDVLACGGTIVHKLIEGHQVFIVYMTDGRHSHSDHHMEEIPGCPTPEELRRIRHKEAVSAAYLLGVPEQNLFFLDYEDGTLQNFISQASTRVELIIGDLIPEEVYYPSEIDFHWDHRATASVVTSALDKATHVCHRFAYLIWRSEGTQLADHGQIRRSLIRDVLELKRKAIYEHKSQTILLFPSQPRPVLDPDFVESFISSDYEEFLVT